MSRLLFALALLMAVFAAAHAALALDGSAQNLADGSCNPCTIGGFDTTLAGIVYVVVASNDDHPTGVTGCSLTYTPRTQATTNAGQKLTSFYAVSAGSISSCTLSVAFSSAPTFFTGVVFGISGSDTSTIWDSNGSIPQTGTTGTLQVSTNSADTFIIGAYRFETEQNPTAGTGFTQIGPTGGFGLAEYKIVSATQSNLSVGIGTGTGDQGAGSADALIIAGGGGGGGTTPGVIGGGFSGPGRIN